MILAPRGSRAFNARLSGALFRMSTEVQESLGRNFVALVLGGGYGRGEGAVVGAAGSERPYNDVDLVAVVQRRPLAGRALASVAQRFERELGVEVDFSRPLTVSAIRAWPRWLMWHDLLNGHVVLRGPPDILAANAPHRVREPPPAVEATRLLLNRGAGLLWALRIARGLQTAPDSDFVRRNYYKCALALGDAALIVHRRFTTRYRGREILLDGLLAQSSWIASVVDGELYRDALAFKLAPEEARRSAVVEQDLLDLSRRWGEALLYVERQRTGRWWWSLEDYGRWGGVREPEQGTAGRWVRNLVRNLQGRRFSVAGPREHLFRELPRLLGLAAAPPAWAQRSERFLRDWRRVN